MKSIFFEWTDYDQSVAQKHNINLKEEIETTQEGFSLEKAKNFEAISIKSFSRITNQDLDELKKAGCQIIALRIAGFNMLDVEYADKIGLKVYRVAAYSPESIAEFAMTLILTLARKMNLNRKKHHQNKNERTVEQMGFLLKGKTLGLHGYGKIARSLAKIARDGFGMNILYFDPFFKAESPDTKVDSLTQLYSESKIVSVHVPLMPETEKCVNEELLENVPEDFMLINTSRGKVLCGDSIKKMFKQGKIKYLGVDVWGSKDEFQPEFLVDNAVQTYHVAFFTEEAVASMIEQTLESLYAEPRPENILPISY